LYFVSHALVREHIHIIPELLAPLGFLTRLASKGY
jgi:hypothetical protein